MELGWKSMTGKVQCRPRLNREEYGKLGEGGGQFIGVWHDFTVSNPMWRTHPNAFGQPQICPTYGLDLKMLDSTDKWAKFGVSNFMVFFHPSNVHAIHLDM